MLKQAKLQHLKGSQPSSSTSYPLASKDDIYSQVLGEDKPGSVRGVGTGPTPATLWGKGSDVLKAENKRLNERVKVLEEKFVKLETMYAASEVNRSLNILYNIYTNH